MTEPTQEEIDAALDWVVWMRDHLPGLSSRPELCAAYANHVTTELQAKLDRISTLEAELAARDFMPIGEEHRDGGDWLLYFPGPNKDPRLDAVNIGHFCGSNTWWVGYRYYSLRTFTHAAPLPQPPKEGE